MVLRRRAELAATSRADDLALRVLAEIVEITSDENVRIVGGRWSHCYSPPSQCPASRRPVPATRTRLSRLNWLALVSCTTG
jgi:hypothetical protein